MAETAPAIAPEIKPAAPRRLPEARFRLAEQVRNTWNVVPEEGSRPEALLEPGYWAHNARKLRPTDHIEAMPDDGSWYAEYIVRSVGPTGVYIAMTFMRDFAAEPLLVGASNRFEVKWKGPHYKWTVVDKENNANVQPNFDTAEAANRWIAENSRVLAARKAA